MEKLDVYSVAAMMFLPHTDDFFQYQRAFGVEPESEKLFLQRANPAQKIAYVSRYILSPEGEIFLLEQNDLQLADTYFEEWELSPEAQKKMLLEAHPDMVYCYVQHQVFTESNEPLLFVSKLKRAAEVYVKAFPLFQASELAMMAMNDADMVADYIDHDDLHEAAEILLLTEKFRHLVPAYHEKWGLGAKAQALYNATVA